MKIHQFISFGLFIALKMLNHVYLNRKGSCENNCDFNVNYHFDLNMLTSK